MHKIILAGALASLTFYRGCPFPWVHLKDRKKRAATPAEGGSPSRGTRLLAVGMAA